jgi:hypothetical protein
MSNDVYSTYTNKYSQPYRVFIIVAIIGLSQRSVVFINNQADCHLKMLSGEVLFFGKTSHPQQTL